MEYLRLFMPDVVVVDTNIPDMDAFSLIRAIRASGERVGIVLVTSLLNDLVYAKIFALQIECTVRKPYNMSVLAGYINNIAMWMQKPNQTAFLPENLVDTLLIDLGFSAGMDKYQLVKRTILARYYGAPGMLMKQVYLDVAKTTGNNNQIEKAVRDAINAAWEKGVRGLWDVYFRMHKKKENGGYTP